jgi:hypothetical protein
MNSRALIVSRLQWIAIILCCACAVAVDTETKLVPEIHGWVNDMANILSDRDRIGISDRLSRYHDEIFHQLVVLTVPSLSGESSAFFGTDLDSILEGHSCSRLVVAGINTHACIRATVVDGDVINELHRDL